MLKKRGAPQHKKLVPAQHETLIVAKCIERGCPFPREPGHNVCQQHFRMRTEPLRFVGESTLESAMRAWWGVTMPDIK